MIEYQCGLNEKYDPERETLSPIIPEDPWERVDTLEMNVKKIKERLNEIEKHVKEIDMDVNDLFDDVEGKYEDNNKQSNTNN